MSVRSCVRSTLLPLFALSAVFVLSAPVNAQELYEFTVDAMPQDAPGSLTSEQYWNVTAWLLAQNNVSDASEPLGPDTARGISLSRR